MSAEPHSPLRVSRWSGQAHYPYIVVSPPFTHLSAGIRALHWLCDALNRAGLEAYVAIDPTLGPPGADLDAGEASGLKAPRLDQDRSDRLHASGRPPIVIYPETCRDIQDDQFTVDYLLNYRGVLGGDRLRPNCDFVMAYSRNIASSTADCQDVLFIPASDPEYWAGPSTAIRRRGDLVYAGKYVDFHHQALPLHLRDAARIYRYGSDAPTRDELRSMLRGGRRLFVFENTAVATEAALCGCPVVACFNWFFRELIAEHELGRDGIAYGQSPEELGRAEATVSGFRTRYLAALDGFGPSLLRIVERTQQLAASRAPPRSPFMVPAARREPDLSASQSGAMAPEAS